jgi:tetratricopeptide (TPR) repeat protein/predicted Ser/Thr protein kinase
MGEDARDDAAAATVAASRTRPAKAALERGASVDRYVIVDQLGEGGMGVVYKAFDPELNRPLALKLISGDDRVGTLQDRLLREAQALARLSHPSVIAVHDVGTFGKNVFIAMEFVEGQTLRQWIKEAPRSLREILQVFAAAGEGLEAAHRAGLVHRDFKPDNVMLGKDGRVRVLDFGLARCASDGPAPDAILAPPSDETETAAGSGRDRLSSSITRAGAIVGTPSFMAPEQHRGEVADERADQFSFCVSLHHALYQRLPFAGETVDEYADNVLGGRIEEPPVEVRVPRWLHKVLVRGLAVHPADRYPSMAALLSALRADPRISRRIWMGRAGAVVVLGLVALAWQRDRRQQIGACEGAERKLQGVWDDGRRAAVRAAFLHSGKPYAQTVLRTVERALDEYTHSWSAMHVDACEATHLRHEQSQELLDLRMTCLGDRLTQLKTLTELYAAGDAGVIERAVASAESMPRLEACADAAALRAPVPPPSDPATLERVAEVRRELARANALESAGQDVEGLAIASRALAAAKAVHYRPVEAEAELRVARLQGARGDYVVSSQSLKRAHVDAIAGRDDEVAARAAINLIPGLGDRLNRYDEADQWAELAEATVERLHSKDELLGTLYQSRSFLRICEGKYEDALADAKLALQLKQRLFGPIDTRVADAHDNLGTAYYQLAQYVEALKSHQEALRINEQALGRDHPVNAIVRIGIGNVYEGMGQHEQALEEHRRALAIYERVNPAHPNVHVIYTSMGNALFALGRSSEALEHYRRGFDLAEKKNMSDDMVGALLGLGESSIVLGRLDEALRHFERALEISERVLGPAHMMCGFGHAGRAEVYRRMGRLEQARAGFERAVKIFEDALGPKHPYVVTPLLGIGQVHLARHQAASAIVPLERALAIAEAKPGDGFELAEARFALARALWDSGQDRERAKALATWALATYKAAGLRGSRELPAVEAWLARH